MQRNCGGRRVYGHCSALFNTTVHGDTSQVRTFLKSQVSRVRLPRMRDASKFVVITRRRLCRATVGIKYQHQYSQGRYFDEKYQFTLILL